MATPDEGRGTAVVLYILQGIIMILLGVMIQRNESIREEVVHSRIEIAAMQQEVKSLADVRGRLEELRGQMSTIDHRLSQVEATHGNPSVRDRER